MERHTAKLRMFNVHQKLAKHKKCLKVDKYFLCIEIDSDGYDDDGDIFWTSN